LAGAAFAGLGFAVAAGFAAAGLRGAAFALFTGFDVDFFAGIRRS
jgi:hypothetical protein